MFETLKNILVEELQLDPEEITLEAELANDLGIKRVRVVANKVRDEKDEEFVRANIPAEDLLGMIHYNLEMSTQEPMCRTGGILASSQTRFRPAPQYSLACSGSIRPALAAA